MCARVHARTCSGSHPGSFPSFQKRDIFTLPLSYTHTHTHTRTQNTITGALKHAHTRGSRSPFLSSSVSLSPLLAAPVACVFHDFCFVRVFMFCSRPPISLSLSLSLSINLSLHRSSGLRTARPLFRLETKYHNADNTAHTSLIFSYFFVSCLVCLIWRPSSSCLLPFLIPTACLNKQTEMARSPFILVFFSSVKPII